MTASRLASAYCLYARGHSSTFTAIRTICQYIVYNRPRFILLSKTYIISQVGIFHSTTTSNHHHFHWTFSKIMDRDSSYYTPSSDSTMLGALLTSPQIDDSNADSAVTSPTLVSCSESGATTPDSCSSTQTPLNGCDLCVSVNVTWHSLRLNDLHFYLHRSPSDVMLDEVNQKLYNDSPESLSDISNSSDSENLPPELADLMWVLTLAFYLMFRTYEWPRTVTMIGMRRVGSPTLLLRPQSLLTQPRTRMARRNLPLPQHGRLRLGRTHPTMPLLA